jgi:hypothetical protein
MKNSVVLYFLVCLLALAISCKPASGSVESREVVENQASKEELIAKYFPIKALPLEVVPGRDSTDMLMKGKDKELLFPDAKEWDIVPKARLELFPEKTTLVYGEYSLENAVYIVSYEKGKFTLDGSQIIAEDFSDGGESMAGSTTATIEKNGTIIKRTSIFSLEDDEEGEETVERYKYTANNKLMPLK